MSQDVNILGIFIEKNGSSFDTIQQILNYRDLGGETFLHIAAEQRNTSVIDQLLLFGFKPDIEDDYGKTALHKTLDFNTLECLLRHGANPNAILFRETYYVGMGACEVNGGTVLHRVALYCNDEKEFLDLCKLLLQHGINPNIRDKNRQSAADLLYSGEKKEKLNQLITEYQNQEYRADQKIPATTLSTHIDLSLGHVVEATLIIEPPVAIEVMPDQNIEICNESGTDTVGRDKATFNGSDPITCAKHDENEEAQFFLESFCEKNDLKELKNLLEKFNTFLPKSFFGSIPSGMKEVISLIDGEAPVFEILYTLRKVAKNRTSQNFWHTRQEKTIEAYQSISDFFSGNLQEKTIAELLINLRNIITPRDFVVQADLQEARLLFKDRMFMY